MALDEQQPIIFVELQADSDNIKNQLKLKAHLNYTRKLKDLLTIFEKSFSSHRLARLLAPFWLTAVLFGRKYSLVTLRDG